MDAQLKPRFLRTPSFLPRVTKQRGRALEQILAGQTLFDGGAELSGAITEASYAATDPLVLRRLRETGVPFLIDPQTLRFCGERFLETDALQGLDYAPSGLITAESSPDLDAREFARRVLDFQQRQGVGAYIAPALPGYDRDANVWAEANRALTEASCALNGSGEIEKRPLLAFLAPGRRALEDPDALIEPLLDLPLAGAFVEPLAMNTTRDGVEKLYRYIDLLETLEEAGLPVVASRVGSFGPVLTALGISSFSSGLGEAESSNLASLNRPKTKREKEASGGGGSRRVYLHPVRLTVAEALAAPLLADPKVRAHFACDLGCCHYATVSDLPNRGVSHYLWSRNDEVRRVSQLPTKTSRIDALHEELRDAQAIARVLRKAHFARQQKLPSFEHLDRWLSLLARRKQARTAA